MTLSNLEQEEIWIEAWNDLYDLIEKHPEGYILIPEYRQVSVEEAKGWVQDTAYSSQRICFSIDYYKGKKSIFIKKVP